MTHVDATDLHTCSDHCRRPECVQRRFTAALADLIQCSGTYEEDAAKLFEMFDIYPKGTVEKLTSSLNRKEAQAAPGRAVARKAKS